MKSKLFCLLAGVALLGLAGAASAQEPIQLSDNQMDKVTAGATSTGIGIGAAVGTMFSGVSLEIDTAVVGHNAIAFGDVASVAASFTPGPGAAAASGLSLLLTSP
jgi:hypothetical protein